MESPEETPIIARLKEFISFTGLSKSQFADHAGIPRPTLSQMLQGRNKSVNDQMLRKLDESFPSLNLMWLLFGRGDMLTNENFEISELQNLGSEADSDADFSDNQREEIPSGERAYNASEDVNGNNAAQERLQAENSAIFDAFVPYGSGKPYRTDDARSESSQRQITSIIVLYSDNSFETFLPPKN